MKLKPTLSILFAWLICLELNAQNINIKWKFKTNDKVISSPLVESETVYFGSEDGYFYAINAITGLEKWKFKTDGKIRSTATLLGDIVFFESENVFYAINKISGKEIWRYNPENDKYSYKIDPYDDKRSIAFVADGNFYVGSSQGKIYGFRALDGKIILELESDDDVPIRSSPLIENHKLYFGDWNGIVYCYDIIADKYLWKIKTYQEKPYDTFGGIASEFLIRDNKLFFGSRNPLLTVLHADTGEKVWNYNDEDGGWIIGDPVIIDNILYMGGSDNFKMFAFNLQNGKIIWEFNSSLNIYTKPVIKQDYLIFSAGNAYKEDDPGGLFVIDRKSGKQISKFITPKGAFSSPATLGNTIFFGCYDGNLYAVEID